MPVFQTARKAGDLKLLLKNWDDSGTDKIVCIMNRVTKQQVSDVHGIFPEMLTIRIEENPLDSVMFEDIDIRLAEGA